MTEKMLWNDNWEFCCRDYKEADIDRLPDEWECVTLPHDWLIFDTQNLYRDSIGWYRKEFFFQEDNLCCAVRFEAVYMDATIYLNGQRIKEWKYGYSTFDVDLTGLLKEGKNIIMVRVVHRSPNSRWYSGAGIYRNVWMIKQPQTHFVRDGIYITPVCLGNDWEVQIDTEVKVGSMSNAAEIMVGSIPNAAEVKVGSMPIDTIEYTILDTKGTPIARVSQGITPDLMGGDAAFGAHKETESESGITEERSSTRPFGEKVFHSTIPVNQPALWDIGQGNLYTVQVKLLCQNRVVDMEIQRFGFRTIRFDAANGFYINGQHVKIKGVCEHHGFGCLGAVTHRSIIKKKLLTLRSMGVNAIRTSHNMPSVEFMEIADEMGFLVDSEAFDMWGNSKTTYDYGRFFDEWMPRDVKSWIRRDRNHPSIIMWSLGNEIYDMHAGEKGLEELKSLITEALKHDPKGHAILTFASNYMRWENTKKCAPFVAAVGYNYGEYLYEEHHKEHPDWVIYGSETASMLGSRNVYHFPITTGILCEDDEQCSSLGNCFAGWGAHSYLDNILWDRDAAYSLGQFIWTGFDYFGEPTPYHTRNSYFGQIDTAGFPKDSFYIYQAEWTDYKKAPMVHVFPYWDYNEGQPVDVCVCSNAPSVELFVNGKSLGIRQLDHQNGRELVPHWTVPYEQGEISAVAYDESNRVIAVKKRHSFGNVAKLNLKAESFGNPMMHDLKAESFGNPVMHDLKAESFGNPVMLTTEEKASTYLYHEGELIFVEISASDRDGYPVENANNRVHIEVTGSGQLIGIDNGDSTDFDQVKGKSRRLFQGKLLAVIAPNGAVGEQNSPQDIIEQAESHGAVGEQTTSQADCDGIIRITVTSPGLPKEVLICNRKQSKTVVSVGEEVCADEVRETEIPIRKLTLLCNEKVLQAADGAFILNQEQRSVTICCRPEPENATYHDVKWKIVNDTGIEVSTATVQIQGDNAVLEATGDGAFKLRCIAMNGRTVASVRSELSFRAEDLGSATLNPYEKIQGGLSSDRPDSLSEGVEHGVRFLGKKETYIRFENLDFGNYGTETIVAELFKYGAEPIHFTVFIENPEPHPIGHVTFDRRANWLEFLEQSCQLTERLTGVRTIGISSEDNFQLKTLHFEPILHGLEQIAAADCDEVYGDTYEIIADRIENIGNNVTLHFGNLNVGNHFVNQLILCGRTTLPNCSVRMKIGSGGLEYTELLEFEGCNDYTERRFDITPVNGNIDVQFIFMPGSRFDFAWFRLVKESIISK